MSKYILQYNLQFFAKDGPGGEKTEEPTSKKLSDAREKGQVARSADLVTAVMLLSLFLMLKIFVGSMGNRLMAIYYSDFTRMAEIAQFDFTAQLVQSLFQNLMIQILMVTLPIFLFSYILTIGVEIYQVKWKPTLEPLKPKLDKVNPISGMKKLISMDKIMELLKSLLKLGIIGIIVYTTLNSQWGLILQVYDYTLEQAIAVIGNVIIDLGLKISVCFFIFAFADVFYQKRKFRKDMMMTKQEIKDEYKNTEGDPQIKGKIRQKMREVSRQRMMQALKEADVVITNPTHFAVAVKYDKDASSAPVVVAKGADLLAAKIKEVARENDIEIVENKPLARMIYFNVELGDEIPQELYQMVAEVLAYVYRIKNKL
ncbi:flagellar biosynthesis protein FlhB [Anaeromicropila populeti]|uniref:Flagellar biosynthetic protein FlhB n=1 Tax=Anaeromicropila populeti TaxID=37658 RepID=A0A1I6KXH1_9FIRM|nr:flagellar biosynthesis protein FlhB [Anaeromicropila populeti]SFR95912.1 flagellar biosynthetic protein FlhB [Anaeromicropila populeti]